MKSVGACPHVEDGGDGAEIEFAIEMREQLVIARGLPAQRITQRIGIDRDQKQPGLAEKVLFRGFRDLGSGRKMDESIAPQIWSWVSISVCCLAMGPNLVRI